MQIPPFASRCLLQSGLPVRSCPGLIACHEDAPCDQDLAATEWFPAGGTYDVDYNIQVRSGSWSKSLVLYWYED